MGWLAKEKEVSMIVLDLEDKRYLFTAKGTDINVAEGRKTDFNEEIENPTTWCIVDTGTATKRAANTVMLSFPDRELYKEFLKFPGTKTLYMPFWTRSEIHKCRKRLYPNLGKQTVNSLLEKWGNIPRYVLEKAMDAVAQRSLEDAIAFCRWEDIMHCVGEPETALHAAHKLVHFKVAAGKQYDQFIMNMASYYVVDKIAEKDGDNHVKHLWDLIDLVRYPLRWGHLQWGFLSGQSDASKMLHCLIAWLGWGWGLTSISCRHPNPRNHAPPRQ
ncbi:hypothetical protein Vafri_9363 [Volvox africanus]|uniref:Uncharacterized protein n=1 Tax=Volvox africanus TaxID=51714 RepID=A0A8J4B474_9CHLO|nr:hypothetical protein Vafri_9363 [Volvox africanus]